MDPVPYLDNLFGPQSKNLERALDRSTQRHALLVGNLANVNTPGYKRRDLDFNIVLEQERGKMGGVEVDRGSIRIDGNSVDLEQEVMQISQTELRYQTLTEMTSRYFSGLRNVIREGR
jgi:flagellar basal-body rod protein FlgB